MKIYIGKDGDGRAWAFSAMPNEGEQKNADFVWIPSWGSDYWRIYKEVPELLPGQLAECGVVLEQVYETDLVKRRKP